jgi:hypothetical protein
MFPSAVVDRSIAGKGRDALTSFERETFSAQFWLKFKRLRHANEKAAGDRERAIRNVCRLYGANRLDALPPGIRATALALLDHLKGGPFAASLEALVKE